MLGLGLKISLWLSVIFVLGILFWQGVTAGGNPDPTQHHVGSFAAKMDIAVLVFREGLECVLVLAALTASMVGAKAHYRKPVAYGAGAGAIATIITWFIAVGILSSLADDVSALDLQAWTGLLAVVVLLIVMNWFFHKIYWGGWISMHNRKKKELLSADMDGSIGSRRLLWGLGLLGFASFYREGFEVVLFLQTYNLQLGGLTVFWGALMGCILAGIIAVLTFKANVRLPYRKMLQFTGVMLGFVLLIMVGEQVQEMQLAGWISTTQIPWLQHVIPAWMGLWFSVFPNVQTFVAQGLAALFVIGAYYLARKPGLKRA